MFQQLGPNEAISSEGFRIKRAGPFELLYVEDGRKISVEVEPGDGLAVYVSSISSWELNDGSFIEIDSEEITQIGHRISEALNFLNTKHLIE